MKKFLAYIVFLLPFSLSAQVIEPKSFADSVYMYICELQIKHPQIVMTQALIETGNFQAKGIMSKNNLFGFMMHRRVMEFGSWRESVEYYKRWQDRKYTKPTEDYYKFLRRIKYATSKTYIKKLKQHAYTKTCDECYTHKTENPNYVASLVPAFDSIELPEKQNTAPKQKPKMHRTYKVKQGDTLIKIAKRNGTTVKALKRVNRLQSNTIKVGQKLKLP